MNSNQTWDTFPLARSLFYFETPRLNEQGEIEEIRPGAAQQFVDGLDNGLGLEIVALAGGSFQMGSPRGLGYADETPLHLVALAPFGMGRYPVTQHQWRAIMGREPRCRFSGSRLPVENVSWKEAVEFCRKLARRTGRSYRLPSEAQWEYACRGGTSTPFSTGETITTDYANYVGEHTYRGEPRGLYRHTTTPVGQFPPNRFGLYDMHGNLWEWCADPWHADYTAAPFDGSAWTHGGEAGFRVARGGSWHEPPNNCRSAVRLRAAEEEREDYVGFRVALMLG